MRAVRRLSLSSVLAISISQIIDLEVIWAGQQWIGAQTLPMTLVFGLGILAGIGSWNGLGISGLDGSQKVFRLQKNHRKETQENTEHIHLDTLTHTQKISFIGRCCPNTLNLPGFLVMFWGIPLAPQDPKIWLLLWTSAVQCTPPAVPLWPKLQQKLWSIPWSGRTRENVGIMTIEERHEQKLHYSISHEN